MAIALRWICHWSLITAFASWALKIRSSKTHSHETVYSASLIAETRVLGLLLFRQLIANHTAPAAVRLVQAWATGRVDLTIKTD